jgi:predicted nucleic acid-binding protein
LRKNQARDTARRAAPDSIFVDTSAWIALFSARDQNHAEAERQFRQALARKARLTTTNLVVAELHRLILHRVGMPAALQALNRIESSPSVVIVFETDAHHLHAKAWLAKLPSHRLTYTDAVSFVVMQDVRCGGFLAFDAHFLAAGFRPFIEGDPR